MLIIESFGKNIFIGNDLVGYLDDNALFINKHKFADITDDGKISKDGNYLGYVDDDFYIIIKGNEVGYIDNDNNFVFYKSFAKL